MGFALPARITAAAVRSYRTFSPLPDSCLPGGIVFCGTFRKIRFERIPPAVSRHVALWRPDFPPARLGCPARDQRLPVRQARIYYGGLDSVGAISNGYYWQSLSKSLEMTKHIHAVEHLQESVYSGDSIRKAQMGIDGWRES